MANQRIIYWTATGIFSIWMLMNALAYLTSDEAKRLCAHFGFPDYFRVELAIMKILGTISLLLPVIKGNLKEWAYAGFTFTVISGFIAHLLSGDLLISSCSAIIALVILLISYFSYHNLQNMQL